MIAARAARRLAGPGSVTVGTGASTPTSGGGGLVPQVPESAQTLVVGRSVLGLAYLFVRYGGDYGFSDGD